MGFYKDTMLAICSVLFVGLVHIPKIYSLKSIGGDASFYLPALAVAKRGHGESQEQKLFFKDAKLEPETVVTRHADAVLECEVGGSPSPTIHWLKDGIRVQQGYSYDKSDDSVDVEIQETPAGQPMLRLGKVKSRLFIDCVSNSDVATYTCVAETPTERISQSTELKIGNSLPMHSRSECVGKHSLRGEAARIFLHSVLRLEFEGAAVQLVCRADGYPAPACSWRYGQFGKEIQNDSQHELLDTGDLLIRDVNWMEHMGDFFCQCENEYGSDEISTFLYPTEP